MSAKGSWQQEEEALHEKQLHVLQGVSSCSSQDNETELLKPFFIIAFSSP